VEPAHLLKLIKRRRKSLDRPKSKVPKKLDSRGVIQNLTYNEILLLQMKQKTLAGSIVLNSNTMRKKSVRTKFGNL
jgi:hypothetical protein